MTFTKVLVLLVAAVLLVEGRTVSKRATFDLGQYIGSADKATEAAHKTVIAGAVEIVTVTETAKTKILGFLQVAKDMQSKIRAEAQVEIDSIVKNANANAASQTGDQACINQIIGQVEALGANTAVKVADCLLDKVTAIEALLEKVTSTADIALTMAPAAAVAIDECKTNGGLFEAACEGLATLKFVNKVNSVTGDVTKIVATATTMYASLTTDLTTCAATRVAELTPAATKLVAGFAYCQVKAKLLG